MIQSGFRPSAGHIDYSHPFQFHQRHICGGRTEFPVEDTPYGTGLAHKEWKAVQVGEAETLLMWEARSERFSNSYTSHVVCGSARIVGDTILLEAFIRKMTTVFSDVRRDRVRATRAHIRPGAHASYQERVRKSSPACE